MSEPDPREDYDDRRDAARPAARPTPPPGVSLTPRQRTIAVVVFLGIIFVALGWMFISMLRVEERRHRQQSSNNLKLIGLGIHNYTDTFDCVPHNTYSPDGKPLLSWRVHLLPYIEHDNTYRRFKLDEPWDSPNNIQLLSEKPRIYLGPGDLQGKRSPLTYYRGFSSRGAVFERRPTRTVESRPNWLPVLMEGFPLTKTDFKLLDMKDGLGNTILVVEAGEPVEWTKPDDLDASPGKPFPKMGGLGWRNGFQALMGDGSVRMLKYDTPEETLRGLVTHSGGEQVSPD